MERMILQGMILKRGALQRGRILPQFECAQMIFVAGLLFEFGVCRL